MMNRLKTKREGESSRHRMTQTPERVGDTGETKPWDSSQLPNTDCGRMEGGGGKGTKTHPPPKQPGSNRPMVAKARRDEASQRRRMRRWRLQREPAAQGIRPNTPLTQLPLQLKTACTRTVSTTSWRRRSRWEAKPVPGLVQSRTVIWAHNTVRGSSRRGGGMKNPRGQARRGNRPT